MKRRNIYTHLIKSDSQLVKDFLTQGSETLESRATKEKCEKFDITIYNFSRLTAEEQ